jgi:hypothetical protein
MTTEALSPMTTRLESKPADPVALKAELKKISARAMQLKMDLHDLAEELPRNWQLIPGVAAQAYDAFAELQAKRLELEALEKASS